MNISFNLSLVSLSVSSTYWCETLDDVAQLQQHEVFSPREVKGAPSCKKYFSFGLNTTSSSSKTKNHSVIFFESSVLGFLKII